MYDDLWLFNSDVEAGEVGEVSSQKEKYACWPEMQYGGFKALRDVQYGET